MNKLSIEHINSFFEPRAATSHKGNHGHAMLIAGNTGRMGAAVISARACLRAGVGLLTVNIPMEQAAILQIAVPEAMLLARESRPIDLDAFEAVAIGPALGLDKDAAQLLSHLLSSCNKPLLLDADALSILALDNTLLDKIPAGTILTPHLKEFDRVFGNHQNDKDRSATALLQAKKRNIIIVLKGHETLITFGGGVFLNTTGNAGLAKAGSGDALTGIITAFLAQGYKPFDAAKLGVYLHGLAADIALKEQSLESMLITDVIECLGKAFKIIQR